MDSDLGAALAASSTSNAWSTLDAVAKKVAKRVGRKVTPREMDDFMIQVGDAELKMMGVWRTSFGKQYMPIVLVNPAYARVVRAQKKSVDEHGEVFNAVLACTCGIHKTGSAEKTVESRSVAENSEHKKMDRYFKVHDYNAGRHAPTNSLHKATCPLWQPPKTSHLHSWRRGFTEPQQFGDDKG